MAESLPLSSWSLVDAALRGMLVMLLVLLASVLRRDRGGTHAVRASVALAIGLCVQIASTAPLLESRVPHIWQIPLIAIAAANAVLFWIFVQAMFDDDFAMRPVHCAAWLAPVALSVFNCAVMEGNDSSWSPITSGLQRAVPLLFALLAASVVVKHWRADLVEARRRLRMFIAVAGIAYTLTMLALRLSSPNGRLSEVAATIEVLLLLLIVAIAAWHLLRLGDTDLFPQARDAVLPVPVPVAPDSIVADDPAEVALARSLHQLMSVERVYRNEGLTLASLAARLAVPEYRLRRLINQRLGHRNFNAYVNGFRLDEARAALANPAQRHLPVLTIALDAGFQSIGPFNRGFKAATGLTPTEFRQQKLADS